VSGFDGRIELLAAHHDRRNFSCGEPALDEYLSRYARQHADARVSRTYVAAKDKIVCGYYSLAMSAISRKNLPNGHGKHAAPNDKTRHARFPLPPAGEGGKGSLREPHAKSHQSRLPNFPLPVARLARLAVDARYQRLGLGELLLMDALHRCLLLSEEIGMIGVVLDAKHKQAKAYYQRFEFEEFPDAPLTLWLPVGAIQKLFG